MSDRRLLELGEVQVESGVSAFDNSPFMRPEDGLRLWVIFDHPLDFPHTYVARLQMVTAGQVWISADHLISSPSLEHLRHKMEEMDLIRIDRQPEDDIKIVEVWL